MTDKTYKSEIFPLENLNPGTIIQIVEPFISIDNKTNNDILVIINSKKYSSSDWPTEKAYLVGASVKTGLAYNCKYNTSIHYKILKYPDNV